MYTYIYTHQVALTHLSVSKLCGLAEMQLLLATGVRVVLVLFVPADKGQCPLLRQLELGAVKGYAGLGRLAPGTWQGVSRPVWQESTGAGWDIHRAWVPAMDSGNRRGRHHHTVEYDNCTLYNTVQKQNIIIEYSEIGMIIKTIYTIAYPFISAAEA